MLPIAGAGDIESIAWGLILGGRSGMALSQRTPGVVLTTGSHYATTWLDVTGKGLLAAITAEPNRSIAFQLDGGPVYSLANNTSKRMPFTPMLPFKQSCRITGSQTTLQVAAFVLLGDTNGDWENLTPVFSTTTDTPRENTVIDITGSGVLTDVLALPDDTLGGEVRVRVDNGQWARFAVYLPTNANEPSKQSLFFIPFKNRLQVTTNRAVATTGVTYLLK